MGIHIKPTQRSILSALSMILGGVVFAVLSAPVFAHESITGSASQILRNDYSVSGSTAESAGFKLMHSVAHSSSPAMASANFRIGAGFGYIAVHPDAVTDLTALETGAGQVTLTWTSPSVVDGDSSVSGSYRIRWSSSSWYDASQLAVSEVRFATATRHFNTYSMSVAPGFVENKVVSGLVSGVTIYIGYKATDDDGNDAYISSGPACRLGVFVSSAPAAPTGFSAIARSSAVINWEWTDNAGNDTEYRVVAATGGYLSGPLSPSATYFIQGGLLPNTSFSAIVQSLNRFWISSTSAAGLLAYSLPETPSDLRVTALNGSSITVNWSPRQNPLSITSYTLTVSSFGSFSSLSASSETFLSTATALNLIGNTSYFYRVAAYNVLNQGAPPAAPVSTVTLAVPPVFSSFTVEVTSLGVTWQTYANSTGTIYQVEISSNSNFELVSTTVSLTANTTYFTNLPSNTTYFVRARSFNRFGVPSVYSDFGSQSGPANVPTLNSYSIFAGSITVYLDSNGNPESTLVEISTAPDFSPASSTSGVTAGGSPAVALSLSPLVPNTSYQIYARAFNRSNVATSSITVTAGTTTLSAIPVPGGFLSASTGSVAYNWTLSGLEGPNKPGTTFYAQVSTESSFNVYSETQTFTLSASSGALRPNTTYFIRLQSLNADSRRSAYSVESATSTLAAAPFRPSIAAAYVSSVTVVVASPSAANNPIYTEFAVFNSSAAGNAWLQAPSQDAQGIWISTLGAGPVWLTYAGWNAPFGGVTNQGLLPDTTYTFKVLARNSLGLASAFSAESFSTATLAGIPQVSASTPAPNLWVNYSTMDFTFSNSTLYHIRVSTSQTDFLASHADPSTNASISTGVTASGTYYLHVRGENSLHQFSGRVTTGPFKVDLASPTVGLSAVSADTFTVTVVANPAVDALSGLAAAPYQFREITGEPGSMGTGSYQASNSVTDGGLLPNTSYAYEVRARDLAGNESVFSSSMVAVTSAAVPGTISLTAELSSVTVSWANPHSNPGDTLYTMETSTSSDFTAMTRSSASVYLLTASTEGLAANTEYLVRVKAVNRLGFETVYNAAAATATLSQVPAAPDIANVNFTSLTVLVATPSSSGNPIYTEFAIQEMNSGSWIQDLYNDTESTLGAEPAWRSYENWKTTGGVTLVGLGSDTAYQFRTMSRNLYQVPSAFGAASPSTTTLTGSPVVNSMSPAAGVWVNYSTMTFGLVNSSVYHIRLNENPVDFAVHSDSFTQALSFSTGVAASGTYYLHIRGENSGHSFTGDTSTGPFKIDLDSPTVGVSYISADTFTVTVVASIGLDPLSGLTSAPYQFREVTGEAGSMGTGSFQISNAVFDGGLLPNTSYSYQVRARDIAGNISAYSTALVAVTSAAAPSSITTSDVGVTTLAVVWANGFNNPADTVYQTQFSTSPDFIGQATTISDTVSLATSRENLTPDTSYYVRVKAANRLGFDTTWLNMVATVTLAQAPTIQAAMDVGASTASFSWLVNGVQNPSDTRYLLELSTDSFGGVVRSSVTFLSSALLQSLASGTTYQARVSALNRMNQRTLLPLNAATFVTEPMGALAFTMEPSSITVIWDAESVGLGNEFRVEMSSQSLSGPMVQVTEWALGMSATSFIQLSTNAAYYFNIQYRNPVTPGSISSLVSGTTRTLAVTPEAPYLSSLGFDKVGLAVSTFTPITNPTDATNDTEFAIWVTVNYAPHNARYVAAPNVNSESSLNNASQTPVWRTFAQWNSTTGVTVSDLNGGSIYNFQLIARNGDNIPTSSSTAANFIASPGAPRILLRHQGQELSHMTDQNIWINYSTPSFRAVNSAHFHWRFNTNINTLSNFNDPGFAASDVITATASSPGPWYIHVWGDSFGFQGVGTHAIGDEESFLVKIDTFAPTISSMTAQYGPSDFTPIADAVTTLHRQPYITWTSTVVNNTLESPIVGFSYIFSTGAAVEPDMSVDVSSEVTSLHFQSADRPAGSYFFTVRAKDEAGNWGAHSTFTYVFTIDSDAPSVVPCDDCVSSIPQEADGHYIGLSVRPTVYIQFDDNMKPDTMQSTETVRLYCVRDNLGVALSSVSVDINLSYNSVTQRLRISPANPLQKGYMYWIVVGTGATDLGGNALSSAVEIKFETVMDRNAFNRIVAADGKTSVEVPAGAFSEDASISVRGAASGSGFGAPWASGFASMRPVLQQSIADANSKLTQVLGLAVQQVTVRELNALNSNNQKVNGGGNFNSPVTLVLPFDVDASGYVVGTTPRMKAKNLQVFVLNETDNTWQRINDLQVDETSKVIRANVHHFSVYSILSVADTDVSNAYAYPVPYKPSMGHRSITFTLLPTQGTIKVYTVNGELVREIGFSSPVDSKVVWDARNSAGEDLGSDVYVYIITSGDNKKTGKLMVVR